LDGYILQHIDYAKVVGTIVVSIYKAKIFYLRKLVGA
jgi:hypothetical protein